MVPEMRVPQRQQAAFVGRENPVRPTKKGRDAYSGAKLAFTLAGLEIVDGHRALAKAVRFLPGSREPHGVRNLLPGIEDGLFQLVVEVPESHTISSENADPVEHEPSVGRPIGAVDATTDRGDLGLADLRFIEHVP